MPNNTYSSFYIPMPPPPPPAQPPKPPAPPAAQQPPASPPPPPPPPARAEVPPPPPPPEPKPEPAPVAKPVVAVKPAPPVYVAPAPAVEPLPVAAPVFETEGPPPNLFLAVVKRWQWIAIGLIGGLVGGFLFYLQRPASYQSSAQLLVIKNRPESSSAGGADTRAAYVEDYVATQVTLMKSRKIMAQAAARLDEQKPFAVAPPDKEWERVNYLTGRFGVARDREPGTNTPSNVLVLTFRATHPADGPKYLRAIIEAYQGELVTLYEQASVMRVAALTTEVETYEKDLNRRLTTLGEAQRDLNAVSQENLGGIRIRISASRTNEGELQLKKLGLERDILTITKTGPTRQERLTVMEALGVRFERPGAGGVDSRSPEDLLIILELQRTEMAKKYGEEHPDLIAVNDRITQLKGAVAKQADGVTIKSDELDRHLARLRNELSATTAQLAALKKVIAEDEKNAAAMTTFQNKIDTEKSAADRLSARIDEKRLEKDQISNSMRSGGYTASAITPPADGGLVAPILREWLLLGGVLGLMLGGGVGLLAELSDRSFRNPAEIRRRLGIPVLGHVPRLRTDAAPEKPAAGLDPSLVAYLRPSSAEAEAYRGVRAQLLFSAQGRGNSVVQVTSPNPGDGKSTLAANLAIALAQTGKRVILVDCDFRKPRVHKLFNLSDQVGLASVMNGDATLEAATKTCAVPNLSLLPCGPRPANPGDLFTLPKYVELLTELRAEYDFVLLDTPPVLAVADPKEVARRVDGVMLVIRMTKDARPKAERAKEDLVSVGARILGAVVNASSAKSAGYGGYGYSYQYNDSYTDYGPDDGKPLPKKG